MLPQGLERAFVQDLVYTTVRRFRPLRKVLGELVAKWPKGELEALLLVGGAQILYMSDVPDFAAVNETVDAAKCCENKSIAKVVNGTLRNLIRRRAEFEAELAAAPLAERESYPNALVRRWTERYGAEKAEALAKWHNQPAETWLAYKECRYVRLARGQRVTEADGYAEGAFVVQDPATALAVELLDVKPGQSVLDFCAAPGGKTAQIAWRLMENVECEKGNKERGTGNGEEETAADSKPSRLVAQEVNPARLRRLRENLARLHLDWVETTEDIKTVPSSPYSGDGRTAPVSPFSGDGRTVPGSPYSGDGRTVPVSPFSGDGRTVFGQFDRVLVDAPCSNTGVLRRRPDARWRWTEERLRSLAALQDEILSAAAAYVAPGGKLVYSTCSNEPEENADRVAAFLASHPDFAEVTRRESLPHESGHDGAFACALVRRGRT